MGAEHWIPNSLKKGALRKTLKVKAGQNIPAKKLNAAAKKGGLEGRRARLAKVFKSFKH